MSLPQSFFCSVVALLMSTYKTTLREISLLAHLGMSSQASTAFILAGASTCRLGNEEGYSDSPKVWLYKSLERELDFL